MPALGVRASALQSRNLLVARRPALCRLLVFDLESRLLRRQGEAAFNAALELRHERVIAEALPAFPRVVDCHDRPAVRRRSGGVEDLTVGKVSAGVRLY